VLSQLVASRMRRPQAVQEAASRRRRRTDVVGESGRLMVLAADHPARGALRAGADRMAMADRTDLLARIATALSRPGVDGFLGTPDLVEDLLLMGVLDDKVVLGSMNRGGLAGTSFELDDRFTAFDAPAIERLGLDGGKMLCRIDPQDDATAGTLEGCARAVGSLADRGLLALVEPFVCHRDEQGRVRNDLSTEAVVRSVTVAAALGPTSAYTWLKLPVVEDMEQAAGASSLPVLLLGGEASVDDADTWDRWQRALKLPTVVGMVVGRALLYPPDGDVGSAVDRAVSLL
jgi:hypothetical protein